MTGNAITGGIDAGDNEYLAEGQPGMWLWHVRSTRGQHLIVRHISRGYYGNVTEHECPKNWVLV